MSARTIPTIIRSVAIVLGACALILGVSGVTTASDAQARPGENFEEPYYGPGDYYKPKPRYVPPPTRATVFNGADQPVVVSSSRGVEAMLLQPGTSSANRIHDVVWVWAGESQCIEMNKRGMTIWVSPNEKVVVPKGRWTIEETATCSV